MFHRTRIDPARASAWGLAPLLLLLALTVAGDGLAQSKTDGVSSSSGPSWHFRDSAHHLTAIPRKFFLNGAWPYRTGDSVLRSKTASG